MVFVVRQLSSRPDTVLIRYDCSCGCKPGVEYRQASNETSHAQCCCGNLHFAGPRGPSAVGGTSPSAQSRGR